MSDNNLHLLFKRQVPEYVKSTYPLFVEFLKAYQEFLQQTQSQELEKFRDIDTVTDEFVERFKAELAYNIPLDDLQDKRMFLKNLREFYLSRGSEASYKFIFKTFFGKDVEISYPSKQMLRVSDGKWKQDVSIFVRNTSSTATTLFPMSGNYITIKSGNKTLVSYVENVVQYSDNIFEVFIQRDLVKSIGLDSKVSYTDGTVEYSGDILLTPKSIKVLQPGKGFRVGDVFNLKTNLGDGCKIKVTQVDGNGGIVRAKILKFALDYTSNFWSYLYAGQNTQLPPLEYFKTGSDNFLNVGDFASENYIEYGYASKQTYMFYDQTIPVGEASSGASRFFADTNYVGEVYTQIYSDNPIDVNLSDFAQILVEVGACSIYTGYYLSQDGFISDEIYIQDSNYYQAFSYVIKVEEELRKYADLVKTILHPAGMKMFAEFQILNRINISATTIIRDRVIQISDLLDGLVTRGIGYTAYDITYDEFGNFIHTPKSGAGVVLSPSGQLAYILGKKVNSGVTPDTTSIAKLFTKVVEPDFYIVNGEYITKDVIKAIANTIDSVVVVEKDLTKILSSVVEQLSNIQKNVTKNLPEDNYSVVSTAVKQFIKSVQTSVENTVLVEKTFSKAASSSVSAALTNFTKAVSKTLSSTQSINSTSTENLAKIVSSEINNLQSAILRGLNKTIQDTADIISTITDKPFIKGLSTNVDIQDPLSVNLIRNTIEDFITLESLANIERYRLVESEILMLENILDTLVKNISTTQNFLSAPANNLTKATVSDSVQILDDIFTAIIEYIRDLVSTIEVVDSQNLLMAKRASSTAITSATDTRVISKASSSTTISLDSTALSGLKPLVSAVGQVESINNTPSKSLASTISLSSGLSSKSTTKQVTLEAITDDSGSLKLNTYDTADYFYPNAIDYQSDIVSIT